MNGKHSSMVEQITKLEIMEDVPPYVQLRARALVKNGGTEESTTLHIRGRRRHMNAMLHDTTIKCEGSNEEQKNTQTRTCF